MATILVVDDQPENRELLVTLLRYQGHTLLEASDGLEALEITRNEQPELVITDVLMPTMDGYEFVRQVRLDPKIGRTTIIFYTATYLESEAHDLAEVCGVKHILTKPVEPQTVFEVVNEALATSFRPPEPLPEEEFGQQHLMLLTNKLAEKIEDLEKANIRLESEIQQRKQVEEALRRSEEHYRLLFEKNPLPLWVYDLKSLRFLAVNDAAVQHYGYSQEEFLGMTIKDIRPKKELAKLDANLSEPRSILEKSSTWLHRKKDGTLIDVEVTSHEIKFQERSARLVLADDVTDKLKAEREVQQRLTELEVVNRISSTLRVAQGLDEMVTALLDESLEIFDYSEGGIFLFDQRSDEIRVAYSHGWEDLPGQLKIGNSLNGNALNDGEPFVIQDFKNAAGVPVELRDGVKANTSGICIPIREASEIIGLMLIADSRKRQISQMDLNLLVTMADIAGNAIQRTRLFEQTQQRLHRIDALHKIDISISSNSDLHLTLNFLLDQVLAHLKVDAADIYLLNPYSQMLEFSAGRGFHNGTAGFVALRLGRDQAGKAVLERQTVKISGLNQYHDFTSRSSIFSAEGFTSYYGAPLISKGMVRGVLETFQKNQFIADPDWLSYLETLAGQAAIAVDNHALFNDLQQSKTELLLAYEATIEGWSRALDLRDRETEGHTQRVTDATLILARKFGFNESDLVHIRRGAMLHDIGKMGVPDAILHKPGPLDEEEWKIMRKHPEFAYEMLAPIRYLRSALDIPYCHHEKWDGSGYPRGLKDEQIPLTARIFAVVDVWDALSSDRPYRDAWPKDKVQDHITNMAGTHFDPQVVNVFLGTNEILDRPRL